MKDSTDHGLRLAQALTSNPAWAAARLRKRCRKKGLKKSEAYWHGYGHGLMLAYRLILRARADLKNPTVFFRPYRTPPRLP